MSPSIWTNAGQKWWTDAGHDKVDAGSRAAGSMRFIAWGTDGTAPAVGQTALLAEAPEARVTGTVSRPTDPEYQVVGEITATENHLTAGTGSIKEAGLFNQATVSGSVMDIRGTHAGIEIETGDRVEYTILKEFLDVSEV